MVIRSLPLTAVLALLALAPLAAPEGAAAKVAPVYLALGDSHAFGVGATNPAAEGYVALTADALRDGAFASTGLELVNLSEPDATSTDLVAPGGQLEQALAEIATRQADEVTGDAGTIALISIDVGSSDLSELSEPDSPCYEAASSGPCRNALSAMLGALQANLTLVLRELRAAAPAADLYVVDVFHPYLETGDPQKAIAEIGVQQVNGVIAAASSDEDLAVHLVTVHELFKGGGEHWVAPDGVHPNNDGHRVLAEALIAAIEGRDVALPTDLTQPPDPPPSANEGGDDTGIGLAWLLVIVPVAFASGAIVSAAYFAVRSRR